MTESSCSKRVTCKRRHPNQHFHELLESLFQDAVKNKSSIVTSLKQAISSLEKYPLPLTSGAECAILKGFDQRLCNYIDSNLHGQPTKNKVSKISDNGPSINEKVFRSSPPLAEISISKMTSTTVKKNHKKSKKLETNTGKCPFQSKFGESSYKKTVDNVIPFDNLGDYNEKPAIHKNSPCNQSEKNNNTATDFHQKECEEPETLNTYFVNRDRKDSDNLMDSEKEQQDNPNDFNFALYENWDSFKNSDQQSGNKPNLKIRSICQPIEVINTSEEENAISDINLSSDDESTPVLLQDNQRDQCLHVDEAVQCKQCVSISNAADAFQLYFKEKTKKDAEEIGKCVLPRKMYKPAYRSSAYAILVALLEQRNECPYRDCLTKEELIQKAQKHTDQSFTSPKPESNYTAWTNTKRLISKGMIQITNFDNKSEDFYMLTAMGRTVAMELAKENTPKVTVNDVIFHGQRNDRVPSLEDVVLTPPPPISLADEDQSSVFIEMPPGTFDIVMLIDKRENLDKSLPASPNNYCKYEARSLTIGDFLWIARSKKTGQELVLPYIVERKRLDDLASSIKDGRFHEQKFRLRKCGLKNVLYLVESYKKHGQYALPMATLMQGVVNTSILEEFNIVKTDCLDHTFKYLGMLSESLVHEFLPLFLRGCNRDTQGKELMTFEFFNKVSCKNKPLTVRDTFIKMLLQLKGLSIEKALAITHKYSTPRLLMKAYERCTVKEGELLLANLKFNNFTRNVGPVVSKTVYKLFSTEM